MRRVLTGIGFVLSLIVCAGVPLLYCRNLNERLMRAEETLDKVSAEKKQCYFCGRLKSFGELEGYEKSRGWLCMSCVGPSLQKNLEGARERMNSGLVGEQLRREGKCLTCWGHGLTLDDKRCPVCEGTGRAKK